MASGDGPFLPILAQPILDDAGEVVQPSYFELAAGRDIADPVSLVRQMAEVTQASEKGYRHSSSASLVAQERFSTSAEWLHAQNMTGHPDNATRLSARTSDASQLYAEHRKARSNHPSDLIQLPRVRPDIRAGQTQAGLPGGQNPLLFQGTEMLISDAWTETQAASESPDRDTRMTPFTQHSAMLSTTGGPAASTPPFSPLLGNFAFNPSRTAGHGGSLFPTAMSGSANALRAVQKLSRDVGGFATIPMNAILGATQGPRSMSTGIPSADAQTSAASLLGRPFHASMSPIEIEVVPGGPLTLPQIPVGSPTTGQPSGISPKATYLPRTKATQHEPVGPTTWANVASAVDALNDTLQRRTGVNIPGATDGAPLHPIPLSLLSAEPVARDQSGVAEGVYMEAEASAGAPSESSERPEQEPEAPEVRGMDQVVAELRWRMRLQERWESELE